MKKAICLMALACALCLTAASLAEEVVSNTLTVRDIVTVKPQEETPGPAAEQTEVSTEPAAAAGATAPQVQRSAAIVSNIPASQIQLGDQVELTAVLSGYEGVQAEIAWERLVDGVWQPTGDRGGTLRFTVNENMLKGQWRVTVTVASQPETAADSAVP